jgi:co-chaperonin GroES (HSP10)
LLIRPYPVNTNKAKTSLLISSDEMDFMNHITNIGRVVAIGKSCWNKAEHKDANGERYDWVNVGDFVAFPRNTGGRRKFKGVSYVLLNDDEIVERLPDPQVFDDGFYKLDIPQEHLEKYNTIYKKEGNNE